MREQSVVMLKPNAFSLRVVGEIVHRIEKSKFQVVAARMLHFDNELAGRFYAEHKGKPFFRDLVNFITSGPTLALVVEAENAIQKMRKLIGATDPASAEPGTIRHDYAPNKTENVVHASDSRESAEREKALLFHESEEKVPSRTKAAPASGQPEAAPSAQGPQAGAMQTPNAHPGEAKAPQSGAPHAPKPGPGAQANPASVPHL